MKNIIIILFIALLFTNHVHAEQVDNTSSEQQERVVDYLDKRDGLFYAANENVPFTGKFIELFPNGKKYQEKNYVSGKLNGLTTLFYKNGKKSLEVNLINGELNGLLTSWDENGRKKVEESYANGKKWNSNYV